MKKINISILVLAGLFGGLGSAFATTIATTDYVKKIVDNKQVFTPNAKMSGFVSGTITDANGALVGSSIPMTVNSGTIGNANIGAKQVSGAKIDTQAVTSAKVGAKQVTGAKIYTGQVTSAKISDGTITSTQLGASAVTSAKVPDGTITSTQLGTSAVTSAKVPDGTITSTQLGASAVTSAKIPDGTITGGAIGQITLADLVIIDPATSKPVTDYSTLTPGTVLFANSAGSLGYVQCSVGYMLVKLSTGWTCIQVL